MANVGGPKSSPLTDSKNRFQIRFGGSIGKGKDDRANNQGCPHAGAPHEAATEVYAEQGYRQARVRDIFDLAGTNIGAINSHFGDKRALYEEVVRRAFVNISDTDSNVWDPGPAVDPVERLRAFIKSLLAQLLGDGPSNTYIRLVTREMVDPTPALEPLIEEGICPQIENVSAIVRGFLGDDVER